MKDTGSNKRNLNLHLGNITDAAGIIDCIVQTFLQGKELPPLVFRVLMLGIALNIIFRLRDILQKLVRTYRKQQSCKLTLLEKKRNGTLNSKKYVCEKDRLNMRLKKSLQKGIRKKAGCILAGAVTIFALCLLNPENTHAYWDWLRASPSSTDNNKDTPQTTSDEPETCIPVSKTSHEYPHPLRERDWRFVLLNPGVVLALSAEVENEVFFFWHEFMPEDNFMDNYVKEHFSQQLEGVDLSQAMTAGNKTFSTYNIEENGFKKTVSETGALLYLDEWLDKAPRSDQIDAYMDGRNQLNTVVVDGKQGNYEIWWKLANDNQYYAQEYNQQTKNGSAILYYYGMSIYCCMRALTYSMDDNTYQMIYHYMAERYHDIRDNNLIDNRYRVRAGDIYAHM